MEAAAKEFAIAAPSRDRTNCFCLGSIRDSRLAACTLAYTRVEAQRDEAERLYSIAVVLVQAGTAHTSMHTPWHNNIWECCCLCTVKLNKGRTAVNGFVYSIGSGDAKSSAGWSQNAKSIAAANSRKMLKARWPQALNPETP